DRFGGHQAPQQLNVGAAHPSLLLWAARQADCARGGGIRLVNVLTGASGTLLGPPANGGTVVHVTRDRPVAMTGRRWLSPTVVAIAIAAGTLGIAAVTEQDVKNGSVDHRFSIGHQVVAQVVYTRPSGTALFVVANPASVEGIDGGPDIHAVIGDQAYLSVEGCSSPATQSLVVTTL
ncbi:MAG: hypothetical protein M3Y06_02755, partial [Actinomycetota bacterium]|nr:hypothetical protein [Actinomycetota bacterium]